MKERTVITLLVFGAIIAIAMMVVGAVMSNKEKKAQREEVRETIQELIRGQEEINRCLTEILEVRP